jgi:hypothetical protein
MTNPTQVESQFIPDNHSNDMADMRSRVINNPSRLEGYPLDVLACTATYAEFEAVFNFRRPVSSLSVGWCLASALERCNVEVIRFLFQHGGVTIDMVRRRCLPHWVCEWSRTGEPGHQMMRYMLEQGLDIVSPPQDDWVFEDEVATEGGQSALAFWQEFV